MLLFETIPELLVFASIGILALFTIWLLITAFLSKHHTAMDVDIPEECSMDVDPVTKLPGLENHDGMETVQLPGKLLQNGTFLIRNVDM